MNTTKYLVRLDDASPYMHQKKWEKIENILHKYKIKPIVGIIPHNEDSATMIEKENIDFWSQALKWQNEGWTIAMHGFNHCYMTKCGGINPIHKRSEFAGLTYNEQKQKIQEGYQILQNKGLNPTCFFAPSHTFDHNTIKALKEVTPIRLLSDTIARKPYLYDNDFTILPCQMGKFRNIFIHGYWTFCFHPNIMDNHEIATFETFIAQHQDKFIAATKLPIRKIGKRNIIDSLMSFTYFTLRKMKK